MADSNFSAISTIAQQIINNENKARNISPISTIAQQVVSNASNGDNKVTVTDTDPIITKTVGSNTYDTNAKNIINQSYKAMGAGNYDNIFQNFLSRLDRHGTALVPLNAMNYGYTFITRPRLNMTTGNLKQHPVMATLASDKPDTVAFMIRCLLDTRLTKGTLINIVKPTTNDEIYNFSNDLTFKSPLLDIYNPFFIPLCNGLKGMSGWPDFNIETETTEGDFHSGDFTFVKGSDMNNRSTELSLEFRDIQGSIILAIFHYWCLMMALQAKGVTMAYPDDIYEQRLNYTVSIYRFITDVSRKKILWWGKATGCFPKSVPVGAIFNVNHDEVTISSAMNFSIPFTANDVKYNDPGILTDFNKLVRRYAPQVDSWDNLDTTTMLGSLNNNFAGIPLIVNSASGDLELIWKTNADYYGESRSTK